MVHLILLLSVDDGDTHCGRQDFDAIDRLIKQFTCNDNYNEAVGYICGLAPQLAI